MSLYLIALGTALPDHIEGASNNELIKLLKVNRTKIRYSVCSLFCKCSEILSLYGFFDD